MSVPPPKLIDVIDLLVNGVDSNEKQNSVNNSRVEQDINFKITPATENDIPAILRLIRGLADYEHMSSLVNGNGRKVTEHIVFETACGRNTGGQCKR